MTRPRTAVITIAHGRHRHLAMQERALAGTRPRADLRCLVALDDVAAPELAPDAGHSGDRDDGVAEIRSSRILEAILERSGFDQTIGRSGACGVNRSLNIRMPFTLTRNR